MHRRQRVQKQRQLTNLRGVTYRGWKGEKKKRWISSERRAKCLEYTYLSQCSQNKVRYNRTARKNKSQTSISIKRLVECYSTHEPQHRAANWDGERKQLPETFIRQKQVWNVKRGTTQAISFFLTFIPLQRAFPRIRSLCCGVPYNIRSQSENQIIQMFLFFDVVFFYFYYWIKTIRGTPNYKNQKCKV